MARNLRADSRSASKLASPAVVSGSGAPLLSAAVLSRALNKASKSSERRSVSPTLRPTSPPPFDMDEETFVRGCPKREARRNFPMSMMVLGAPIDTSPESPENWREMYAMGQHAADDVMAEASGSDDDKESYAGSGNGWELENVSGKDDAAPAEVEMGDVAQAEVQAADAVAAVAAPNVAGAAPEAAAVAAAVVQVVDLTSDEVIVKAEKGASEPAITSQKQNVIDDIRQLVGMIESASSEQEKTILRQLLAQVSAAAGAAAAGAEAAGVAVAGVAAAGVADGGSAGKGSKAGGSKAGGSKASGSKAGGSRASGSKVETFTLTIKYSQEEFLKFLDVEAGVEAKDLSNYITSNALDVKNMTEASVTGDEFVQRVWRYLNMFLCTDVYTKILSDERLAAKYVYGSKQTKTSELADKQAQQTADYTNLQKRGADELKTRQKEALENFKRVQKEEADALKLRFKTEMDNLKATQLREKLTLKSEMDAAKNGESVYWEAINKHNIRSITSAVKENKKRKASSIEGREEDSSSDSDA